MAQVHRTNDPNLWFNPKNFRETPGEGVLAVLSALQARQKIWLLVNGTQTLWTRFAGGALALSADGDAGARQTWNAIAPGTWVTLTVAPGAGIGPAIVGGQGAGKRGAPPAAPVAQSALPATTATSAAQFAAQRTQRGRLFDAYLFIDWSATNSRANSPGPDQLWLGELLTGSQPKEKWFQSRLDCGRDVEQRILQHVASRRRVLVGFDFPYGYPAGLVEAAGLPAPGGPWLAVWTALSALLHDDEQNRSNRFDVAAALNTMMTPPGAGVAPGPFWNTPAPEAMLTKTSPAFPYATRNGVSLPEWRIVEQRLWHAGPRPHSAFKLFTAGSVGSQILTGIPIVHRARINPLLREVSVVWPFETGFGEMVAAGRRPLVVHAEIWPGIAKQQVHELQAADPQLVKDQAQVRAMCQWAEAQDAAGTLAPFFSPQNLSVTELERCVNEEGWILGVP
jgi:hypothetical protein